MAINSFPIETTTIDIESIETNVALAEQYRDEAVSARDVAFVNADVYATTAEGIANTSSGDQFQVVDGDEIVRYSNSGGTAVELARYPNSDVLNSISDLSYSLEEEASARVAGDEYLDSRIELITRITVVDNADNTFTITTPDSPLVTTDDYYWRGFLLPTFTITL